MHTILLLARHGQTVDNERHVMQGQTPGQLNDTGRQQARELARRLAHTHIDAFVASDLTRAIDTCAAVAQPRHMPIDTTPLLRERDWGSFTGRYIPDLKDAPWADDIESTNAMCQRARLFLQYIATRYAGQTVLAVGHGIINKAIQSVYYDKPMRDITPMQNVEVRTLTL